MTIEDQTTPSDVVTCGGATRRHALAGLAVAAGALCAACSSSSSKGASGAPSTSQPGAGSGTSMSSPPASSGSSSDTAASSSGSTSGSASGSSSSSGSAGSGGTALAPVSAVPVGGGKILADQGIVLTQPSAGTIKAFSAVCTHQGCSVATIEKSLITCPCHGSQFKIADGSVANGPATQALAPKQVKVENGQILLVS
ncbi:MAG: Rieske (2Fe-2S) protein [Catenulispora sp.]|nr:Rieske (2Fe-2S) protein [Catenulispora sp.]